MVTNKAGVFLQKPVCGESSAGVRTSSQKDRQDLCRGRPPGRPRPYLERCCGLRVTEGSSEELSGGLVDDSDVNVVDNQDDGGSFVFAADHDVKQSVWSTMSWRIRGTGNGRVINALQYCSR